MGSGGFIKYIITFRAVTRPSLVFLSPCFQQEAEFSVSNLSSLHDCWSAWLGGGFRGERIHAYVWLSAFSAHLK